MDINYKKAIKKADKYLRQKKYKCLWPGCNKFAINSHAIQKSTIKEAIAINGYVYTYNPSYTTMMRLKTPFDPLEIVKIGINKASTIKCFCSEHDNLLFIPIETSDSDKKRGMAISYHLRSLAFEYCRQRRTADFFDKLYRMIDGLDRIHALKQQAIFWKLASDNFYDLLYVKFLDFVRGTGNVKNIDFLFFPFPENLLVSCSGCKKLSESEESTIGFNLISYSNFSVLFLTEFKSKTKYIDRFVNSYNSQKDGFVQMINDLPFRFCEDSLISPQLWEKLDEKTKKKIGLSMRPPVARGDFKTPLIFPFNPKVYREENLKKVAKDFLGYELKIQQRKGLKLF